MNEKYPGDTVTKTFTFTDETDAVFDPDTITLDVKGPDGVVVESFDIDDFEHGDTEEDKGIYTFTYPIPSDAAGGTWTFELTATQTVSLKQNKETFEFKVLTIRQHYGSFERVKRLANLDADSDEQDDRVDDALADADTIIEGKLAENGGTVPLTGLIPEKIRMICEFLAAGHILWVNAPQEKDHPFTIKAMKWLAEYINANYGGLPIFIGTDTS